MPVKNAQSVEAGRAPLPLNVRQDSWWVQPIAIILALVTFSIYAGFRAFENNWFELPQFGYLSPFYSPPIHHWFPNVTFPFSTALILVIFPLAFRGTCYYCRKAYYRAFFMDPPACALHEPTARMNYTGESKFPFVLQSLHRYAMYIACFLVVMHWIHAYEASVPHGFGVGSLIFLFDAIMLTLYVGSCHSVRHLIGGNLNHYSKSPLTRARYQIWKLLTRANEGHAVWFWLSLLSVILADLYVRLVSAGFIADYRIF